MKIEDRERLTHERGEAICQANGYTHYTRFSNGRDAALKPLMFTVAIISDLTEWGHGDRWCYDSMVRAKSALEEWKARDGEGEPGEGWHRHPDSGRRRPGGDASKEYIDP